MLGVYWNWIRTKRKETYQSHSADFVVGFKQELRFLQMCIYQTFLRVEYIRQRQSGMRSRIKLLLMSCGIRSLSDRIISIGRRLFKIQIFLLYNGIFNSARRTARSLYLWISVSVRMASGFIAQIPTKSCPIKS